MLKWMINTSLLSFWSQVMVKQSGNLLLIQSLTIFLNRNAIDFNNVIAILITSFHFKLMKYVSKNKLTRREPAGVSLGAHTSFIYVWVSSPFTNNNCFFTGVCALSFASNTSRGKWLCALRGWVTTKANCNKDRETSTLIELCEISHFRIVIINWISYHSSEQTLWFSLEKRRFYLCDCFL